MENYYVQAKEYMVEAFRRNHVRYDEDVWKMYRKLSTDDLLRFEILFVRTFEMNAEKIRLVLKNARDQAKAQGY